MDKLVDGWQHRTEQKLAFAGDLYSNPALIISRSVSVVVRVFWQVAWLQFSRCGTIPCGPRPD
jgi:hypothetical protein